MRIGHGFDVHKFGGVGPVVLAGVAIPYEFGFMLILLFVRKRLK